MGKKSRQKIINRELKIQNAANGKKKRKKILKISLLVILILAILGGGGFASWKYHFSKKTVATKTEDTKVTQNIDNQIAVLDTNYGEIKFRLLASAASKTVENFVKLANEGFYNGIKFHRVIKDFMIQAGDPLSKDNSKIDQWGTGGPGYKFNDEPVVGDYTPGTVAMANSGPNTNGSQFFIMAGDWSGGKLAKNYNIFGTVMSGMDVVAKIDAVKTNSNDRPEQDVLINKITIETEQSPSATVSPDANASSNPIQISPDIQAVTSDGKPVDVQVTPTK
ncbi:MAG: peptidylprolyl isomerase [Patescibacteria group bacterium]|nr:peptidylprolyl isomerase [Patescibacteria group bacterium]